MAIRIAGISFEHMHMGDNLRMAFEHPDAEVVGICDERPERMSDVIVRHGIGSERVFTDARRCLEETRPDLVILCPAAARHGEFVETAASYGAHVLIEKPFAASLAEADAMIVAQEKTGKVLAINWPLAWDAIYVTARRLLSAGAIGDLLEVHHYGGNRGPLWHTAGKRELTASDVAREKPRSWFYQRAAGGGSLLDYLGYGATLGTWFQDGRVPREITCMVDEPPGLEVDEHSVTVARYDHGLSKFETRWGTFTDPWTFPTQPRCGFTLVGNAGTMSCHDYAATLTLQDAQHPEGRLITVEPLRPPYQNPVQYLIHCLVTQTPVEGPLSVAVSRLGQRIVDTAYASAQAKRTLPLVGPEFPPSA